jgi:AAA+ ATPase superfamily predicted ATPase
MVSPFVYGKIASGDAFTDREEEQKRLSENIRSHINSVLISPRRWGKSSLVLKVGDALQRGKTPIRFCYIDLFNVRTEQEFYSHFAREVLRVSYSKWDERLNSAKRFFKRLTPKFSMGTDPLNDFSVSFDLEETKDAPDEILDLPERICQHRKIELVICLDEFQNIGFFDEPLAFQKKMRAQWQHHKHATYCLYGSKRHMMTELFENKSMPFYKFGDVVFLQKIPEHYWVKYLIDGFARTPYG